MENLSTKGMVVYVGEKRYAFKVHLVGSFGDIPSVSEMNFLSGHMSYWGCRFCTIRSSRVKNTMCFGKATNDEEDPVRLRTIDEFKNGDLEHGIKEPSIFRNLPSFTSTSFIGLDEFHMFGLNIAKQLVKFLKGEGETILKLKHRYWSRLGASIKEQGQYLPCIFDGEMKDVLSNTKHARGVDYMLFLKYIVPTFVTEQIQVQQTETSVKKNNQEDIDAAIEALSTISKICSIATQYDISNAELQELDKLIPLWHNFFVKYLPEEKYNINQHYLLHVTDLIRDMGSLSKHGAKNT